MIRSAIGKFIWWALRDAPVGGRVKNKDGEFVNIGFADMVNGHYQEDRSRLEQRFVEHRNLIGEHARDITNIEGRVFQVENIIALKSAHKAPIPRATKKVAKGKGRGNAKHK